MTQRVSWFFRNGWVVALSSVSLLLYGQGMKSRKLAVSELQFRLSEMEKEYHLALQEKEEFTLQLDSQSDPAWVELVLLRQVGVVPDGFLKVHFNSTL